ncbi:hypothetical protein BCR36DRAFT_415269 [Piromyces finnis]|nr:hypothetical protein BCR36DRAFT_417165 [Piromyces finnis]ORX43901.1 hypothetical protein BCR36DRAFT_415269 [Piromyces finnis]|eukprot:ORX35834.1 hypothetical protein BCR36DRAFT_417165 [Piromyces finnis]
MELNPANKTCQLQLDYVIQLLVEDAIITVLKSCNEDKDVNCEEKTYNLVVDEDKHLLQEDKSIPGLLYYCETNNDIFECNKKGDLGYYINSKNGIYTCTQKGCSGYKFGKSSNGKIEVIDDNQFNIYLIYKITADVTMPAKNYLVGHECVGSIFGTSKNGDYIIITIDENSVTSNSSFDHSVPKFVYTNSLTNEILNRESCSIDITEFEYNESDDVYNKHRESFNQKILYFVNNM